MVSGKLRGLLENSPSPRNILYWSRECPRKPCLPEGIVHGLIFGSTVPLSQWYFWYSSVVSSGSKQSHIFLRFSPVCIYHIYIHITNLVDRKVGYLKAEKAEKAWRLAIKKETNNISSGKCKKSVYLGVVPLHHRSCCVYSTNKNMGPHGYVWVNKQTQKGPRSWPFLVLPSGKSTVCYWKWPIYSCFTWFTC